MGCNCGKGKQVARSAMALQRGRKNPNTIPLKVQIKDWSETPQTLIGAKTGVSYGPRMNGEVILMWKSDVMAAPQYYDVLEEAK